MKQYFEKMLNMVGQSVRSMDTDMFEELCNDCQTVLEKGKKVIVSGLGKNVPVCDKFAGTMNSLGLRACCMNTNSAVHGDIGMVEDDDLVIVLTKSGETAESVYLTSLLEKRQVTIWLLSFQEDSTLVHRIPKHLILSLEHEGDPWDIVPNNSTTVNLIILQGLAISLAERMGVTLAQFKKNHPGGFIGEQLKNV